MFSLKLLQQKNQISSFCGEDRLTWMTLITNRFKSEFARQKTAPGSKFVLIVVEGESISGSMAVHGSALEEPKKEFTQNNGPARPGGSVEHAASLSERARHAVLYPSLFCLSHAPPFPEIHNGVHSFL